MEALEKIKIVLKFLKHIADTLNKNIISNKIFNIYDMNIEYCTACGFCEKTGFCKFKDDMTPMYKMFDKAKGVIVISPVNFDSVTAKLKTLVDRTRQFMQVNIY